MLRPRAFLTQVAVLLAVLAGSSSAWAVLRVTNGGFDAQDGSVHLNSTLSPTGWFSGSILGNTQSDTLINSQNGTQGRWIGNAHLFGNSTPFANDGTSETGFIYQSLGTYSGAADNALTVVGYLFNRILPGNRVGGFDVGIYITPPGSFTPGNGDGVTNFDVQFAGSTPSTPGQFVQGPAPEPPAPDTTYLTITTGTTPQRVRWTYSTNLAGFANVGDQIWLRIGDAGNPGSTGADEPIIDDVSIMPFDLGDTDGDGDADLTDFTNIRNNFRKTGIAIATSKQQGDLDGSGDVDFFDYLQWRERFVNAGGSVADIPALVGVPEPASCGLAAMALASFAGLARRRARNK